MKLRIKSKIARYAFIAVTVATLLSLMGFAKPKPIMTTDILQYLRKGEPWDRGVFTATKMVMFQQADSGGTNSTVVAKITLSYFTSTNCTATNGTSVPSYTTPDGTSFTISTSSPFTPIPFGMVAASAWNVGNSKVSPAVADMTAIQSIAVTLKSTNSNTPQAAFTNGSAQVISYACIPVTCTAGPSGECTSGSGTQSFTLKTTAAVGDPADGGVIGCQNTGISFNLFDIVVTTSDQATNQSWAGGSIVSTGATSTSNGATNTTTIVTVLGTTTTYAARTCNELSVTGGFTSGWFLPSGSVTNSQLNCLYNNEAAITIGSVAAGGGGFTSVYWSSTEASSTTAWRLSFTDGTQTSIGKNNTRRVRCSRAF